MKVPYNLRQGENETFNSRDRDIKKGTKNEAKILFEILVGRGRTSSSTKKCRNALITEGWG